MRKYRAIALFTAFSIMSVMMGMTAGCSLFKKNSKFSPDNIYKVCVELEAEEYDNPEDFADDLDDEFMLDEGLCIKAEGKDIRTILVGDELETLFRDAGDSFFGEFKSTSVTAMTMYVCHRDNEKTSASESLAVLAMGFDDDNDSEKYFKNCKKYLDDAFMESDDNEGFSVYTSCSGRKGVCCAVYIDGKSVLVITGIAKRGNDLENTIGAFCEAVEIETPDISDWDLDAAEMNADDAFAALADHYSLSETTPRDFDNQRDSMESAACWTRTTDLEGIERVASVGSLAHSDYTGTTAAYLRTSLSDGFQVMVINFDTAENAHRAYMELRGDLIEAYGNDMGNDGEADGMEFYRIAFDINFANEDTCLYCCDTDVYAVLTLARDLNDAADLYEEIIDIMGLPYAEK